MKRILSFLLLICVLLLTACSSLPDNETSGGETTGSGDKSSLGNVSQGSPPMHPSYHFTSFDSFRNALFVSESDDYKEIRSELIDPNSHSITKARCAYGRFLEFAESAGAFPMPYVNGTSIEEIYLTNDGVGIVANISVYLSARFNLPMICYDVLGTRGVEIPDIRVIPLMSDEDQTLQEYTDIVKFHSYMGGIKSLGKTELQLADRTVSVVYRYFNGNEEDGRYEYMFLYDGYYVSVFDTQDVLTEEFWSGFSIEMAQKKPQENSSSQSGSNSSYKSYTVNDLKEILFQPNLHMMDPIYAEKRHIQMLEYITDQQKFHVPVIDGTPITLTRIRWEKKGGLVNLPMICYTADDNCGSIEIAYLDAFENDAFGAVTDIEELISMFVEVRLMYSEAELGEVIELRLADQTVKAYYHSQIHFATAVPYEQYLFLYDGMLVIIDTNQALDREEFLAKLSFLEVHADTAS